MLFSRCTFGAVMRTNIDIDDTLMAEAMKVTGLSSKKATVETALRKLVELHSKKEAIARMTGLGWEGDLNALREGRDAHR